MWKEGEALPEFYKVIDSKWKEQKGSFIFLSEPLTEGEKERAKENGWEVLRGHHEFAPERKMNIIFVPVRTQRNGSKNQRKIRFRDKDGRFTKV